MRKVIIIALVAALALVAAACSSGGDDDEAAPPAAEDVSAGGGAELEGADDAVAVSQPARAGGSLPSVGPSIVQTASLALTVPRGEFDATIQQARSIAAGFGGFVVSSTASQGDEQRLVRGSLVVRVPERVYARAMDQLSGLGTVQAREETGQDVSQELVDLEARIRHLEAVEARLLNFLDQAETVNSALSVQSELNRVQLELEQARGRLDYLDDQVAYATISLEVSERGAEAAEGGGWALGHRRCLARGGNRVRHRGRLDLRCLRDDRANPLPSRSRVCRRPAGRLAAAGSQAAPGVECAHCPAARPGIVPATNRLGGPHGQEEEGEGNGRRDAGPTVEGRRGRFYTLGRRAREERAGDGCARQGVVGEGEGGRGREARARPGRRGRRR